MNATVLYDDQVSEVAAKSDKNHFWLSPENFAQATGWKLEPQGLCRGDACVRTDSAWINDAGEIDLLAFAQHMGQPVVHDEANQTLAFGESVNTRRDQMFGVEAPDFILPDLDGKMHSLSDYRGKKIFMYSWGSY